MKTTDWTKNIDTDELAAFLRNKLPKLVGKRYKAARKSINDVDYESWLHKVGLQSYSPGKKVAGSLALFALGAIAGSLAALALTPVRGPELRAQVKDRANKLIANGREQIETAKAETNVRA